MTTRTYIAIIIAFFSTSALNAATTGEWDGYSSGAAFGTLDGVRISAFSTTTSPFIGVVDGRFSDEPGGGWNADMPLPPAAQSLVTADVNGGDAQVFRFASGITDALLYIENFDASSIATVTADNAELLELVAASDSISFESTSQYSGVLSSSNPTYNGEGDAVLHFMGDVRGITLQYSQGDGANGIFYGFAVPKIASVPEPSCVYTLSLVMAFVPLARRRHR